jgi:hypothetical protein
MGYTSPETGQSLGETAASAPGVQWWARLMFSAARVSAGIAALQHLTKIVLISTTYGIGRIFLGRIRLATGVSAP